MGFALRTSMRVDSFIHSCMHAPPPPSPGALCQEELAARPPDAPVQRAADPHPVRASRTRAVPRRDRRVGGEKPGEEIVRPTMRMFVGDHRILPLGKPGGSEQHVAVTVETPLELELELELDS